jgi:hypothetical protein
MKFWNRHFLRYCSFLLFLDKQNMQGVFVSYCYSSDQIVTVEKELMLNSNSSEYREVSDVEDDKQGEQEQEMEP